jgi:hypothetical protein
MKIRQDKRPKEFTEPLTALPKKIAAVRRLYALGTDSTALKIVLTFVGPRTLTLRIAHEESGKELLRFETDGRASLTRRPGKRPVRAKGAVLPSEAPRLANLLLGTITLSDFGLSNDPGDFERTYTVGKKTQEKRSTLQLTYRGADSIGRDQEGEVLLDEKTGLPVYFSYSQSGNSPRDDGEFHTWERWSVFQATL